MWFGPFSIRCPLHMGTALEFWLRNHLSSVILSSVLLVDCSPATGQGGLCYRPGQPIASLPAATAIEPQEGLPTSQPGRACPRWISFLSFVFSFLGLQAVLNARPFGKMCFMFRPRGREEGGKLPPRSAGPITWLCRWMGLQEVSQRGAGSWLVTEKHFRTQPAVRCRNRFISKS